MNRLLVAFIAAGLASQGLFAQGNDTRAKATDWEEINFEFNQAVIVDGFPAMLRLADLLKAHPDYKVNLVGNTDSKGGEKYNDALALKRANAVAQFLQKYGASSSQIVMKGDGKRNPEASNKDVNGRFINRRVVITVTAPNGTVIGDGSIATVVNDFEVYARGQLSKIDSLLSQLRQMEGELQAIKGDTAGIAAVKSNTDGLKPAIAAVKKDTAELVSRPAPLSASETTEIATVAANTAADRVVNGLALANKGYALAGVTFGGSMLAGKTSTYSIGGYGKLFKPFGNGKLATAPGTHAFQIDGEWIAWHGLNGGSLGLGHQDGFASAGVVNRFGGFQMGAFGQGNYVNLNGFNGGGFMMSGIATLDYVFSGGSVGVFGTHGFKSSANLTSTALATVPAYFKIDDSIGFHSVGALGRTFWIESAVAFKKRLATGANKLPSADVRFYSPLSDEVAVYAGFEFNTTYQNTGNQARVVVGLQWGSMPKAQLYNKTDVAPVYIPRPHYEFLLRP